MAFGDSISTGCGPATCDADPDRIVTNMIQEKGRLSSLVFQNLKISDQFLAAITPTKEFFPAEMGDVLTDVVLDVSRPAETDVLAWSRVGGAKPGYNPCCNTYKEVPYGSRTVTACLYQDGWKSPTFCKIDLAFKYRRDKQIQQQLEIMTQWSKDIWSHWARRSFQRSVQNVTLNAGYGHPEQLGSYVTYCNPASILTFQHLEVLFLRVRDAGGELSRVVKDYELIFIGVEELRALVEQYYQNGVTTYGFQNNSNGLSGVALPSLQVPGLGRVKMLDKYLFAELQYPVRYRDRVAGESWEDAIVPSTIHVDTERGTQTQINPDYRNPSIAKYSESYLLNLDAVRWLVPPSAMTSSDGLFPATDYSGDFELIAPPRGSDCDPKQKSLYFLADFMSGMISHFPKRARAILQRAVHTCALDVIDCCPGNSTADPTTFAIQRVTPLITADTYQILIVGTAPTTCPDGHDLFIVTKKGDKILVGSVDDSAAFAGDATLIAGTLLDITLPATETVDLDCASWDYLACLPSAATIEANATTCDETASTDNVCTAIWQADNVGTLRNGADADVLVGAPFASAALFQAAVQAYIDGLPLVATAVVTEGTEDNDWEWKLVITSADAVDICTALAGFDVSYVDAFGNTVSAPVSCVC